MHAAILALGLVFASSGVAVGDGPEIDTKFEQVAPTPAEGRSEGETRAVVLIHGLRAHPFSASATREAELHDWQRAGSTLVDALAKKSDVYAFAYGQNASIPEVARCAGFRAAIDSLAAAGYEEIVLLGHSSGAVIAREHVEAFPGTKVTKLVQVSPPNAGSHLVKLSPAIHTVQVPFLDSIRPDERAEDAEGATIPEDVEMVVVVADGFGVGDLAVRDEYQWPPDLQAQGIPAVQVISTHFTVMRSSRIARILARLVSEPQPRWTPEEVEAARREMVENPIERALATGDEAGDEAEQRGAGSVLRR